RQDWMFQVTSTVMASANPRPQERLDELALEDQEGDQERCDRHQGRSAYDRNVDAAFRSPEQRQSDRQRSSRDGVGDDQGPQEVVPVGGDGDERIGEIYR